MMLVGLVGWTASSFRQLLRNVTYSCDGNDDVTTIGGLADVPACF